jgi:aminoglycoside phosphotransferase
MWDHHNGADSPHDETVGRYASLADAQARVRSYLLEQWDEDFFDSYEEEEGDDGELEVYAQCPEGAAARGHW